MTRFAAPFALGLGLALAGCGPSDNEPGPGGVTIGEAKALDQAAEMIERRRLPPEAISEEQASPTIEQISREGERADEQ